MATISLQMYTMREHTKTLNDLEKTLERLREMGFQTLQYSIPNDFNSADVKKLFDKNSIKNDSVFCPHAKLSEMANKILGECHLFETEYVRTDAIPRENTTTAEGYQQFAHYLNRAAEEYKTNHVKVLYHFHAFEFRRFGDTCGIEILLRETDPEVIQMIPDTHWIHSGGKDVCDFLTKYKDRYDYVHTKDFGIGLMGECWEARPIEFAPVGEGNLDWKSILEVCKANNVISYAIEQDNCYGRDPFDCVKSSFDFLKKMGVED